MKPNEIKARSYEIVKAYERRHGREIAVVERDGYDLDSWRGARIVRRIEVKGTMKQKRGFVNLVRKEVDALERVPDWYLYLVLNVGDPTRECVIEFTREEVKLRKKVVPMLHIPLRAKDFGNCEIG